MLSAAANAAAVNLRLAPGTCFMTAAAQPANTEIRYEVTRADLPLSCPMPSMAL